MASKKYRGKTCAYCGIPGISTTQDHIFAKGFVLTRHRNHLPAVPACESCNSEKSRLETYLLQIMPLAANHSDGLEANRVLMQKRSVNQSNKVLHGILCSPDSQVWLRDQTGRTEERIAVYIDATKLENWLGLVSRGLAFLHWNLVTPNFSTEVIPLNSNSEREILRGAERLNDCRRIKERIGNGAFAYRGFNAEGSAASAWIIELLGGMPIGGDPLVSTTTARSWIVFIAKDDDDEVHPTTLSAA